MKICVVGIGYVGFVFGMCFAEMGNDVVCIDNDEWKLECFRRGEMPIYEPGLSELVLRNQAEKRLIFSSNLESAVAETEVAYIAVGTPESADGSADLSAVFSVARTIGRNLPDRKILVVIKSTVPVGTNDRVKAILEEAAQGRGEFEMASNPEFLKEGCAIDDFMRPDRIIIGCNTPFARQVMEYLYSPLVRTEKPILFMDIRSAEMTKYAANAFLATKISFINEIANLCEHLGADVNLVRKGIGSDSRIGYKFLFPGVGYGGSCFPKDVQALAHLGKQVGYEAHILQAVDQVNDAQKRLLGNKLLAHLGSDLTGKTIAVWGLAFKPQTDDMREAPSLVFIEQMLKAGATVRVYDPVAMDEAKKQLGDRVLYAANVYHAAEGADAVALITEWNEFRRPDFARVASNLRGKVVFDGRNIYDSSVLSSHGLEHICIGRR